MPWILAALMFVHGLIHLVGALPTLGPAAVPGMSGRTLVPLGDGVRFAGGIAWLVALALFVVAAWALVPHAVWWRPLAVAAVIVSQAVIVVWWPDARWGTVANAPVAAGCLLVRA